MGVRTVPHEYQTMCYEVLECGRPIPSPGERMAILLAGTVAASTIASTVTKVDILKSEVKQDNNGYGRRRIGRLVTQISGTGTWTSAGHGMANGTKIYVAGSNSGLQYYPPSYTVLGEPYYIINSTTDTFQVAATPNGNLINPSSLPTGTTVVIPSGNYDVTDRRHESMTETIRFQGTGTTGYTYGALAVIRGGHEQANVICSNFNAASNEITITSGHQLRNGDEVFFSLASGATVPGGLTVLTIYHARSVTTTTFTLHPTRTDAINQTNPIDITSAGTGTIWMHYANGFIDSWEVFPSASTLANGEEQPFALQNYLANIGNGLGLA